MRTNFLSELDIPGATYAFLFLGVVVVLFFIFTLTQTGSEMIRRFVQRHPVLARSINNMAQVTEKVAAMGSTYSVGKGSRSAGQSPKGSTGGLSAKAGAASKEMPRSNSGKRKTSEMPDGAIGTEVVRTAALLNGESSPVAATAGEEKPQILVTTNTSARGSQGQLDSRAARGSASRLDKDRQE